jgi:hypothetical protein
LGFGGCRGEAPRRGFWRLVAVVWGGSVPGIPPNSCKSPLNTGRGHPCTAALHPQLSWADCKHACGQSPLADRNRDACLLCAGCSEPPAGAHAPPPPAGGHFVLDVNFVVVRSRGRCLGGWGLECRAQTYDPCFGFRDSARMLRMHSYTRWHRKDSRRWSCTPRDISPCIGVPLCINVCPGESRRR